MYYSFSDNVLSIPAILPPPDFNAEITHAHDDQVDNTVMGIKKLLAGKSSVWDSLY